MIGLLTLAEWYNSPELMRRWRETWEQEHMALGLQVLISQGLPKSLRLMAGIDPIQTSALQAARDLGYFNFAKNIDLIKQAPKAPDKGEPGWADDELKPDILFPDPSEP